MYFQRRTAICAFAVIVLACGAAAIRAQEAPQETPEASPSDYKIAGVGSLREAVAAAQRSGLPILAVVGGESCPHCRTLAKEMQQEVVRKELARWTVASLHVEQAPEDAAALTVTGIPALRILTPAGKLVAARNGAMSGEDLVAWLEERFESAASLPSAELTSTGELTNLQVVRLVRELGRSDATIREAAIRRLLASPQVAAPAVTAAFAEGSLATRLSALELLTAWKAPTGGIDPWAPETITPERLQAVTAWAATAENLAPGAPQTELTGEAKGAAAEEIRQLLAAEPGTATAIRERLARHGQALLPLVYEALQAAESDEARQRLTELRYRLVATDELVLSWPGGLARLAATEAAPRRQAVDELARRATNADERLLLELFSDSEPLVRELSLRALQKTGGAKANSSLVRLLDDPDPNVRAAVLKQLAEVPAAAVVPRLAAYIKEEQDPDLLVHAVRVLRAVKGKSAAACLMTLLDHESWRVRAEAADAIGEAVGGYNVPDADKVDAYAALVDVLKDEDPFVVSRAVQVLGKANLATVVNPLAEVAGRHPELAVEVVKALSASSSLKQKVAEHLERFAAHDDPKVRAAAVKGLTEIAEGPLDVELQKALEDPERVVRIAAAEGLFEAMMNQFSQERAEELALERAEEPPAPLSVQGPQILATLDTLRRTLGKLLPLTTEEPAKPDAPAPPPLAEQPPPAAENGFEILPPWMKKLEPALQKLLTAEAADERVAAALPLVALGSRAEALPVLEAAVAADKAHVRAAARALRWLPWQERQATFLMLIEASRGTEDRAAVAGELAQRQHPEAAGQLWSLLERPDADAPLTQSVIESLRSLYLGSHWYDVSQAPKKKLDAAISDCRPRAEKGSHWQRLAALSLLVTFDPAAAVEIGGPIAQQEDADPGLRATALRFVLHAAEKEEGQKRALAALVDSQARLRTIALRYLAVGPSSLESLDEEGLELPQTGVQFGIAASNQPAIPAPPEELQAEMLRPFLQSADPQERLHAAYLLCLLGEEEGLPLLLETSQAIGRQEKELTRLVYVAIAALNDAAQVPILTEMYERMVAAEEPDYGELSRFYWTIRNMSGSEVLALRKRMRDEVGIDNLQRSDPFGGRF